jgi:hypothetical protein
MLDPFSELIEDLGKSMGLELYPDKEYACTLLVDNEIRVQLEYDSSENRLLMSSFVMSMPVNNFREDIFKQALKTNNDLERIGTLAYDERDNQLVLFLFFPLKNIQTSIVYDLLFKFIDKIVLWQKAIKNSDLTIIDRKPHE